MPREPGQHPRASACYGKGMTQALLVVDAQLNMFEPEPAHDGQALLDRLTGLVDAARTAGVPVVFVRNEGGPGEVDARGAPGWELHPRLAPQPDEVVIDKMECDAFDGTPLAAHLEAGGVTGVVVAGLQSEFCISATCRGAMTRGFDPVLVGDAHSTFDGDRPAAEVIAEVNSTCGAPLVTTASLLERWGHA